MTATPLPRTQDLPEGPLGIALLHLERGDMPAARRHLVQAVAGGVSAGGNASFFHGAPALEFVLGRTGRVRPDVRATVDHIVDDRLAAARERQDRGELPHLSEFDLVRGLAGLGALLLTRKATSPRLEKVLAYLVSLARPVRIDGRQMPGWWSATGPGGEEMPGGHGNNGMAHGIAGVLSVLCVAAGQDVLVPEQREAIEVMANWLDSYGSSYWTTRAHLDAAEPPAPEPARRPSWCYGLPGIARAQQLAGLALDDPYRRRTAEDTFVTTLSDPAHLARITDASLCHGWAGLVSLTRAVAADSAVPERFTPVLDDLLQRLATDVDRLTKPGLVEGRAGAQLALDGTNTTGWTRALLIT